MTDRTPAQSHTCLGRSGAESPDEIGLLNNDLVLNHAKGGDPIGKQIIVLDGDGCPARGTLAEVRQANAGGRYRRRNDLHRSDRSSFGGCGRMLTDDNGH